MGLFDKLFGKKTSNEIESKIDEISSDSAEVGKREISFSMKYWIDWKPKTKEKDWSKT